MQSQPAAPPTARRLHADCTTGRITFVGVRGGSGTSTIGAALALNSRTMVHAELVTADPVPTSALLGVAPPDQLLAEVLARLVLAQEASGEVELTIIDAGTVAEAVVGPKASGELRLGVLRGPSYLALRTLHAGQHSFDGLVLVAEPGSALNERDVADVTGLDAVATVPATPASSLPVIKTSESSAISGAGSPRSSTPSHPINHTGEPLHQASPKWQAQTCQLRFAQLAEPEASHRIAATT